MNNYFFLLYFLTYMEYVPTYHSLFLMNSQMDL